MVLQINVRNNVKEFQRSLTRVQRKQIPFAVAGALNATAFDAQRAMKAQLPKKFTIRNTFTARGIQVRKAKKTDLTATVLVAEGREYLNLQEAGGTKRPRAGRSIAVPVNIRKSKRQKIAKAKRPRSVLAKPNTFRGRVNGHLGIWQRPTKRGRFKLLYSLETGVRVRKRLNFEKTVRGVVSSKFNKNMEKSLARAFRTAR